ncbi:serine protease inhibitor 77Ba [Anopheles ziemanni]|uniref:serine protease inhibitor 77Ba n=1 Tax=Anopheles coustani TaxID=139045 RepID=UPI0026589562|nr:serine protease inhibitor 77Ba [Anopheles coustani]XP_058173275.1 serine protease inhibitor 77Ba [Anopheles ziemanni]
MGRLVRGCLVFCLLITLASSQNETTELTAPPSSVSVGIGNLQQSSVKFALQFYKYATELVDYNPNVTTTNIIVSPFSVWNLLAVITEGASGVTLSELLTALNVESQEQIRNFYIPFLQTFSLPERDVQLSAVQHVITDENRPVAKDFETSLEHFYNPNILQPMNFADVNQTYERINRLVSDATNGQIPKAIEISDLQDARLIMLSVLFFQGQWTVPFNRSFTTKVPFYDENEQPIGMVEMMFQRGIFPFAGFKELDAQILELPYGEGRHLSMLLIMPRKGVALMEVIRKLANYNMDHVFEELDRSLVDFDDDEVEVHLPKFEFNADYNLIPVLGQMGIKEAFSSRSANFDKITELNAIYISSVIQQSKIVVNEEGTTAAAVTTAVFANKATPPRFLANRPFGFMIVARKERAVLFAGQVKQPNLV